MKEIKKYSVIIKADDKTGGKQKQNHLTKHLNIKRYREFSGKQGCYHRSAAVTAVQEQTDTGDVTDWCNKYIENG